MSKHLPYHTDMHNFTLVMQVLMVPYSFAKTVGQWLQYCVVFKNLYTTSCNVDFQKRYQCGSPRGRNALSKREDAEESPDEHLAGEAIPGI